MLFDVQAALAEILNDPPCDTRDLRDKPTPVAQVSQGRASENRKPVPRVDPPNPQAPNSPHGRSVNDAPLTWIGRVVSLKD